MKDFSPDTQKLAKHTLTKVRKKLALHFVIYKKLQQCDTLTECETLLDSYKTTPSLNSYILYHLISRTKNLPESIRIIEKYGRNVAIDSFTLNALLHKCNSTLDCEHIISQYGKHIALNSISFNYILKAILKDPHSDEQKLNIQTVFDQLQKI